MYSLVVNLIVGPKLGGWFFPTANWWVLVLWVLPPFIALALAIILAISARVSSAAAAQQASALATLPLIVISYGVASNTLFKGELLAFGIGALAWLGAIFALWRASYAVSRERLLGMCSVCEATVLVTKAGDGELTCHGQVMEMPAAAPLPSSD